MSRVILPGATIGVLGSGQLGRMFALAARSMGYRVVAFSPDGDSPTGQIADGEIVAPYDDLERVRAFASAVDVVTFEFENVLAATANTAAEVAPVRPSGAVLQITQHRLREKTFLAEHGFPVTPFAAVHSADELRAALATLGTPAVLKTAGWGYDGKGQKKIMSPSEADAAWQSLETDEAVLEAFIDFEQEVSVVAARGLDGTVATFDVVANEHRNHILDISTAPAQLSPALRTTAIEVARGVLEQLDVVGVLCVEFFVGRDQRLMINELAPRPHNSGHLTIDACVTSQFEQQVRTVCNLPLGSTELLRPVAMANLLGDVWQAGPPDFAAALRSPEIKLHLYGKQEPRPGRKMGHLTAVGKDPAEARQRVIAARRALTGDSR